MGVTCLHNLNLPSALSCFYYQLFLLWALCHATPPAPWLPVLVNLKTRTSLCLRDNWHRPKNLGKRGQKNLVTREMWIIRVSLQRSVVSVGNAWFIMVWFTVVVQYSGLWFLVCIVVYFCTDRKFFFFFILLLYFLFNFPLPSISLFIFTIIEIFYFSWKVSSSLPVQFLATILKRFVLSYIIFRGYR